VNPYVYDELLKQRYQQILREVEAYRLAANVAFSHPATCRSIAAKIWAWLSQFTIISLNERHPMR